MIQFNLLPDIKLEYIKSRRTKHMIILVSVLVSGAAIFVLALLFTVVVVVQKKHLNDLNHDVTRLTQDLKNKPDLSKILTVQNQLVNLPGLHAKKPVATRLFGYMTQVTPAQISIEKLDVGFDDSTMTISGATDSLNSVNVFIDTLKFTDYTIVSDSTNTSDTNSTNTISPTNSIKAFSAVVLSAFSRDDQVQGGGVSYTITLKFDPTIFDSKNNIDLIVPSQITTRSETEKPTNLFQNNSNTNGQ